MPDNGTYILTNVGFSKNEKPTLILQDDQRFISIRPLGESFTMRFSIDEHYCIGWRDITTGERFVCPEAHKVDQKYEQCAACQKRTGFNPAFYHAATVSAQQEARNSEPHILYLAHFGAGIVKVGISHAKRGNARLLEQGARSALILEELSSAHVARHYEAQIAKLPGFSETIQLRKKIDLLKSNYDHHSSNTELNTAKSTIETALNVTFDHTSLLTFDSVYFPDGKVDLAMAHNAADNHLISGECVGLLGSLLFCKQAESAVYLPLKKYVGCKVQISSEITTIDTPAQQTSLF